MDVVDEVTVVGGDTDVLTDDAGGGVAPLGIVEGGAEIFIGDWERDRSDEPAVELRTGGTNLFITDGSGVGYNK